MNYDTEIVKQKYYKIYIITSKRMSELNLNCLQVNSAISYLVDEFGKKYYKDDFQIIWTDWRDEDLHYNLQINDDFRNIDEIYTALWFDIPKKVLFDYYEARLNGEKINLKNFYLMKKDGKDLS